MITWYDRVTPRQWNDAGTWGDEASGMSRSGRLEFDTVGYWSEIKLAIIQKYASAYSTIFTAMARKGTPFKHVYIDGFAGAGTHLSRTTGELIPGSPQIALGVDPPFVDYHFIDLNATKTDCLKTITADHANAHVYTDDCNIVLTRDIFPKVRYEDYWRGLCLLDPYGLHLNWDVIRAAARTRAVEIFLNFPVADMNRNVLWRNAEGVDTDDIARMNDFWGDESWREVAYKSVRGLFGSMQEKTDNDTLAQAFRARLKEVAGFIFVPDPMPMRNSSNSIVYYLFFASQNATGGKIVKDIFKSYRNFGMR